MESQRNIRATRRKRPGTPKRFAKRDSASTKERILLAATNEFAAYGYEGARVDRIADAADANKNLLYHYFGGKEDLFTAVLQHTYAAIRRRQSEVDVEGLDPVQAIRTLVSAVSQVWLDFPEFGRLLDSENLQEAKHIEKDKRIAAMYTPLLNTIRRILSEGAATGEFREDIDPVDLYISMSALMAYYLSHRYTFEAIFSTKLDSRSRIEQRRQHVADMIVAYLRAPNKAG